MKNICNCYLLIAYIQNSQTSSTVIYSLMVPTSLMALDNIQFICQLWSLYRRYNYMNFFYCLHKTSLVLQRSLQISDPILEISLQISDPIPSHESGHIPEQRGLRWTPAPTMSCPEYRMASTFLCTWRMKKIYDRTPTLSNPNIGQMCLCRQKTNIEEYLHKHKICMPTENKVKKKN